MAYTAKAIEIRRCRHVYQDEARKGQPCRAYALWDHPEPLCAAHGGRTRGKAQPERKGYECRTVAVCRCAAYAWPHRPGGGLCCWPEPPLYRCTIAEGTHAWLRRPEGLRWGWTPTLRRTIDVGRPGEPA